MQSQLDQVRQALLDIQSQICQQLESLDSQSFRADEWQKADGGGGGITRVLCGGDTFEQAGVNFSHVRGGMLPPSATVERPELANRPFQAMGVSLVIHPRNPFVPTSHANFRLFSAESADGEAVWWFGGGMDLTPYYGFEEDCQYWHQCCFEACAPLGEAAYWQYKKECDEYFFLKHRNEPRGIGGLFYDDLNAPDFETTFDFTKKVSEQYLAAYVPIVKRRMEMAYDERHRQFQLYRRGRYVEFNLIYDRGTLFGLQSNGRTESILMSLPPLVRWEYDYQPEAGSVEAQFYEQFLKPRNWLEEKARV